MARGKPVTPVQAEQALRLVAEGKTLSEIATTVGLSHTGLHRALTETWADEYAEAKQRRDDVIRNRVWTMGMSEEVDPTTTRWAIDHLVKWHLPEARIAIETKAGGADDIAEAIDRFTNTVLTLTQRQSARAVLDPPAGRPGLPAADVDGPGEG